MSDGVDLLRKVVKKASYQGRWCIECKSLCFPYDQGLTCNCYTLWDSEVYDEKDYPAKWVVVDVTVTDPPDDLGSR